MNDSDTYHCVSKIQGWFFKWFKSIIQKHISLCIPYGEYSACTQNIAEIDLLCPRCLEVNTIYSNIYVMYTIVYGVYIYLVYLSIKAIYLYLHLK